MIKNIDQNVWYTFFYLCRKIPKNFVILTFDLQTSRIDFRHTVVSGLLLTLQDSRGFVGFRGNVITMKNNRKRYREQLFPRNSHC